jgi:hypothetical protein
MRSKHEFVSAVISLIIGSESWTVFLFKLSGVFMFGDPVNIKPSPSTVLQIL